MTNEIMGRSESRISTDVTHLIVGIAGIGVVTLLVSRSTRLATPATSALAFLVVVLLVAATARLLVAVTTSFVAMLAFNFFFLPPVGTFTIADPQNWIALFSFLVVSLVASNLSAVARTRTEEAVARRDELTRLFNLSRDVLLITDSQDANARLAGFVARRFDFDYAAICLPNPFGWAVFKAGTAEIMLPDEQLSRAFSDPTVKHQLDAEPHRVHLVPLRIGTKAIGMLAAAGRLVEQGTFDALAGLAAIAMERVHFLEERKAADLARQSEELKSALLASLSHDLRTPLTAIGVAASNLQASWPTEQDRREQADVILTEVERLNRLFQNILEMARIDAGAITREMRWVSPTEIIDAAKSRVEHALRGHSVTLGPEPDRLVRLDPRLAAAALSHLLENAAQYTLPGSTIDVDATVSDAGLSIAVRDRGPGIAAADLPHVFERFFRGSDAKRRRSCTGMGLAIAKGVLAVEGGRISVENCHDGGARFTIVVPAEVR